MKIGLFGGTFDPVHNGHMALAHHAIDALRLDRLIWIPALPWQKSGQEITDGFVRAQMIEVAIANEPKMSVDRLEIEAQTPSFSIDTLETFIHRYPKDEIFYLIGSDQWANFHTWKNWQGILKCCRVAVFSRNASLEQTTESVTQFVKDKPGCVEFISMPEVPISSSEIRECVRQQGPSTPKLKDLMPTSVIQFLKDYFTQK